MNPHPPVLGTQHCRLVLDLGTTTLAGRLLGADGALLAEARAANPQRSLGADILIRLQHAYEGGGAELQQLLVTGVRSLVADLLERGGVPAAAAVAAAAAGNPGICHLLCQLPVKGLIFPPHRSPLTHLTLLPPDAPDLGLAVPLQLFPALSGFAGGDLLADLYGLLETPAQGQAESSRLTMPSPRSLASGPCLLIDLGTNAELALWNGAHWRVSSAAAGPAFEAANIACGMPLAPGAVTDVQLSDDHLLLTVAGGGRPLGLCGSGLLALIAAARQGGLIDAGGRIVPPAEITTNLARYLVADGAGWALCFHRDARGELRLAQEDVRQLQLAKGAVRAGIEVLLDHARMGADAVQRVFVTGAFGAALPLAAVKGIALLPEAMVDKLFFMANGVLDGLENFLGDPQGAVRLQALQATIKPLPLSGSPAFEQRFLAALEF